MKTSFLRLLAGKLALTTLLILAASCNGTPHLEGNWEMGGPYNTGKPCHIFQDGDALVFVNERGDKSKGVFQDKTTVVATDWEEGLTGILTDGEKRINWKNGTWWLKAK